MCGAKITAAKMLAYKITTIDINIRQTRMRAAGTLRARACVRASCACCAQRAHAAARARIVVFSRALRVVTLSLST